MAKPLLSAIAATALAAFAPTAAHAVSFTFDLTDSYVETAAIANSQGRAFTFDSTTDSSVKVKVTGWSINRGATSATTDDVVKLATVYQYGDSGLGVVSSGETSGSSPGHSMDNNGQIDFLLFQFNRDVDLDSFRIGWSQTDADATVRFGPGNGAWNSVAPIYNKPVNDGNAMTVDLSNYLNSTVLTSDSSDGSFRDQFNTANNHGLWWIISAYYPGQSNDYFKIKSLGVTLFPSIPEPSTWMTMILGFGFIGWGMRRRNVLSGKGSTSLA